jgi:hypothetical protein
VRPPDGRDNLVDLAAERSRLGGPYRLPCPRCGKPVFERGSRCTHCGLWFSGEAYEFTSDTNRLARSRTWTATKWTLLLLLVALVLALGLLWANSL